MSNSDAVLADIAKEINQHDEARQACETKGLMHACRMGQLLIEAKEVVPHGHWLKWLKSNMEVTARMCQICMELARDDALVEQIECEYETISHLNINRAVKLVRQRKTRSEHAKRIIELDVTRREHQRQMAAHLHEAQKIFDSCSDQAAFILWMKSDLHFSDALAAQFPDLLNGEYDDDAWLAALPEVFEGWGPAAPTAEAST